MNLRRLVLALLCLAGASGCDPPPFSRGDRPLEKSFWVWNRSVPLTAPEAEALLRGGVRRVYWQVGELTAAPGGSLTLTRTAPPSALRPLPGGPEIVPVVRVGTSVRSPEAFTGDALGRALRPVVDAAPGPGRATGLRLPPTGCCPRTPSACAPRGGSPTFAV